MTFSFREEDIELWLPLRGRPRQNVRLPNIGMLDNLARFLRYPVFQPTDEPLRIVDAGACVGAFVMAVKEQAPNAVIHAFEPYAPCWPYLESNLAGLEGVTIHKCALGAQAGRAWLGRPSTAITTIGQTSLYGTLSGAQEVEVKTLDDVLAGEKVEVIKADVEGAELDVLKGARRTLAEQRPLLILELKEHNQARAGHTIKDVVDWLASRGYGKPKVFPYGDYLFEPVKVASTRLGAISQAVPA